MFSIAQVIIFILSMLMNDGSVSQSAKVNALQEIQSAITQNLNTLNGISVQNPVQTQPVIQEKSIVPINESILGSVVPDLIEYNINPTKVSFVNPINGYTENVQNIIAELHRVGAIVTWIPDIKRSTKETSSWNLKAVSSQEMSVKDRPNQKIKVGDVLESGGSWTGASIKVLYPADFDLLDMNVPFPNNF